MHKLLALIKEQNPLIHAITNPISINICANAILAVGARPVMAEHPAEVSEITETSRALMLNLGNITDARIKSMSVAGKKANKCGIPVLLDLVGVSCSKLRRRLAHKLIKKAKPAVLKGNYSEIMALYSAGYKSKGVDSENIDEKTIKEAIVKLALKYNSVILASGKIDIITDGVKLVKVKNGTKKLSGITGTGCVLGALCTCFLSVCNNIDAAIYACLILGIAGEFAGEEKGSGSFGIKLMDKLSLLTDLNIENCMDLEEILVEK